MTPDQYGQWAAGLKLRTPMESAMRGAQYGGLAGLPVGAYRYFTSDDPSAKDVLGPMAVGATLGGVAGGVGQHLVNKPISKNFKDQMTAWEATKGEQIYRSAIDAARNYQSKTPFADASAVISPARKNRERVVAEALMNAHGDNDVFKLKTHRGY